MRLGPSDEVLLLAASSAAPVRIRGRHLAVAFAAVAVTALLVLLTLPSGGGKASAARPLTYTAPGGAFSLSYPAGWHATAAGPSAAAIERSDHAALVTVRRSPALKRSLTALAATLPRELRKRFDDYRPLGARAVRLSTGPALVHTFVRTRTGTVETMVVAPAGTSSYTLVAVAKGGNTLAAREAGSIVRSLQAR
jgi:hypothetical protein